MKTPKKNGSRRSKQGAVHSRSKTSSNEPYTALLSNLEAKLAIAEPEAFKIWLLNRKAEDLANWLYAQNQLRVTASQIGKLSAPEVGIYE
jgi:hypothetical protein